jgi:hypothetical protein
MSCHVARMFQEGADPDTDPDAVHDARDDAILGASRARGLGLRGNLVSGPVSVGRGPIPVVAIPFGGALIRRQHFPMPALMLTGEGTLEKKFRDSPTVSGDPTNYVAPGFDRYKSFTEVAAIASGYWQHVMVPGGLRVALPRKGRLADPAVAARVALSVFHDPARHAFHLEGDTYVPSGMSPGDRHALSTSAA